MTHAILGRRIDPCLRLCLSLTKFIRTDEYAQATNAEGKDMDKRSLKQGRSTPLWPVLMAARLISQYPVSLPIFAAFNRMDLFVWAYGVVHMLYAGKTAAIVSIRSWPIPTTERSARRRSK